LISLDKSRSRSTDLYIAVETKSRNLNLVETNFLKVSWFSRLSKLTFFKCRDRDKSRPPGLGKLLRSFFSKRNSSLGILSYSLNSCQGWL
jgi:hypothetical protein